MLLKVQKKVICYEKFQKKFQKKFFKKVKTFKSAQKSSKKSSFPMKSAFKSTLKSTFGSSEPYSPRTDIVRFFYRFSYMMASLKSNISYIFQPWDI